MVAEKKSGGGMLSMEQLRAREVALLQWFAEAGLNPDHIYQLPERMGLRINALMLLVKWVTAWRSCNSRRKMKSLGLEFPPVEPGVNPECDWLRFERWVNGLPLEWSLKEAVRDYEDPEKVSDSMAEIRADSIMGMLADKNVLVDMQEGVPPKIAYAYLLRVAREERFEHLAPGTFQHIGCSAYCPECVQRHWCETGMEEEWPEDKESAKPVVSKEVN